MTIAPPAATVEFGSSDATVRDPIPAPIWIEDWSEIERLCEEQRAAGTTDLRTLLETDEDLLRAVARGQSLLSSCRLRTPAGPRPRQRARRRPAWPVQRPQAVFA